MANKPPWSRRGVHEYARWNVRYDDHWDQPTENELDEAFEDDVGIASEAHNAVVTPKQSLCPDDPEADCRQGEHYGIVNCDADKDRGEIEHDLARAGYHVQLEQGIGYDRNAHERVNDAIEAKLPN